MAAMAGASYPVRLELDAPLEVARWRPLVHWLLSIPYYVVLYVLQIALEVVTFVAWFAILFTGNIPSGMFGFMVSVQRFQWRFSSYFLWLREPYPCLLKRQRRSWRRRFQIRRAANRSRLLSTETGCGKSAREHKR